MNMQQNRIENEQSMRYVTEVREDHKSAFIE